jgi:cytochrome c-type biogenesis protein CcmH/NrfG
MDASKLKEAVGERYRPALVSVLVLALVSVLVLALVSVLVLALVRVLVLALVRVLALVLVLGWMAAVAGCMQISN